MNLEHPRCFSHFADLPDPRRDHGRLLHPLIALCAVLSDAESFVEMEEFGQAKQAWLQERLGLKLPHGIPSHDTFRRLFARLDPHAFEQCFSAWTQELQRLTRGQVIAIDGKTVRHSFDSATGQAALHLVTAWANDNRLVLAQQAVDTKSNEITAVPRLLEWLDIAGCIVTVDALNSHKALAAQIVQQQGDYLFALKGNHALLYEEVADYFTWLEQRHPDGLTCGCDSHSETQTFGHGRRELRRCWSLDATSGDWPAAVRQWAGLRSIVCVEAWRWQQIAEPEAPLRWSAPSCERRYYLSSLACDAPSLLQAVRDHWGIENSAHWVLDVAFAEDSSRIRRDHAPQNMATLRRLALNLLRQDTQHQRGLKTRRHRTAWDSDYLLRILGGI